MGSVRHAGPLRFRPLRLLAPLLLAAALGGCGSDAVRVRLPVEVPVGVGLAVTADNVLSLVVRTEREFGCAGFEIASRLTRLPGGFAMRLEGIEVPTGACATVLAPASASGTLGALEPGRYALGLYLGDRQSTAVLDVTGSAATLTGFDAYWITVETPFVRLPKGGDLD